jgi:hypothetical protein
MSKGDKMIMWIKSVAAIGLVAALTACGGPGAEPTAPAAQTALTKASSTIQAAATQAAPTVQTAATQAAPTVQAAATQMVPTVSAAATQLAPTVQAAATPVIGTAVPAAATAAAASPIQIVGTQLDPLDPKLQVRNTGTTAIDISGWGIQVGTANILLPPNVMIAPGDTLTLHLSAGTSAGNDVYLGQPVTTLVSSLQPGARVSLVDNQGRSVTTFVLPG